jgi:hypothetical protein
LPLLPRSAGTAELTSAPMAAGLRLWWRLMSFGDRAEPLAGLVPLTASGGRAPELVVVRAGVAGVLEPGLAGGAESALGWRAAATCDGCSRGLPAGGLLRCGGDVADGLVGWEVLAWPACC